MHATTVCKRLFALSCEQMHTGTVHSVFDHAVNLEIAGRFGLIGLIAEKQTLTPYAVSVRGNTSFIDAGIRAGMAASIRQGHITIPEAGLTLNLFKADPVDLSIDSIDSLCNQISADALLTKINAALQGVEQESGLAPLITGGENTYTRFLKPRLNALFAAVSDGDNAAAMQAASRIAGCGMGLTPSSDDLLSGYLVTLRLLLRQQDRAQEDMFIRCIAQAAAERTNRISATFLLQSGEGLANAAVYILLRVAGRPGEPETMDRAIARILEIGSTSGADMLTGIALALRQHNGGTNSDQV